jgi:hypothetical protein
MTNVIYINRGPIPTIPVEIGFLDEHAVTVHETITVHMPNNTSMMFVEHALMGLAEAVHLADDPSIPMSDKLTDIITTQFVSDRITSYDDIDLASSQIPKWQPFYIEQAAAAAHRYGRIKCEAAERFRRHVSTSICSEMPEHYHLAGREYIEAVELEIKPECDAAVVSCARAIRALSIGMPSANLASIAALVATGIAEVMSPANASIEKVKAPFRMY